MTDHHKPRSVSTAMADGAKGRCPNCHSGEMFSSYLKVRDHCTSCGCELHHHRADDFPPYLVIFIVGHIVVAAAMIAETHFDLALWLHFVLWAPLTIGLSLALLQPIKGAVVGMQWALRMHGFGGEAHEA